MQNYLVLASYYGKKSYATELRAIVVVGNPGLAVNRAFQKFRKEELKGKRVSSIVFKVALLGKITNQE